MRFWKRHWMNDIVYGWRKRLDAQGVDARPYAPDELVAFVHVETECWRRAVKASGATVN
jgi:hypothetical protein